MTTSDESQPKPQLGQDASTPTPAVYQRPQHRVRQQEPVFAAPWGGEPIGPNNPPERDINVIKRFEPRL